MDPKSIIVAFVVAAAFVHQVDRVASARPGPEPEPTPSTERLRLSPLPQPTWEADAAGTEKWIPAYYPFPPHYIPIMWDPRMPAAALTAGGDGDQHEDPADAGAPGRQHARNAAAEEADFAEKLGTWFELVTPPRSAAVAAATAAAAATGNDAGKEGSPNE